MSENDGGDDGVGSFNGVCMCMSVCVEGCGVARGVQAFLSRITCKNSGVGVAFFLFSAFCSSFHLLNAVYRLNVGPHSAGFVLQNE